MTPRSIKQINDAIKAAGMVDLTLYKGNGYLYFMGNDDGQAGVYVNSFKDLSLEQWLEEARSRYVPPTQEIAMFTKDELILLGIVVSGRLVDLQRHLETHDYKGNGVAKKEDQQYSSDLAALWNKIDKLTEGYRRK